MKYAKIRRYNTGGQFPVDAAAAGAGAAGNILTATAYNKNGSINDGRYIAGKTLSRAGQGAALGSTFGPIGTGVGAAVGVGVGLYEGITGSKKLMAERDAQLQEEERIKAEEEAQLAEQQAADAEYAKVQQDQYNQAYYSTHSMRGEKGAAIYAKYGARLGTDPNKKDIKSVATSKGIKSEDYDKYKEDIDRIYTDIKKPGKYDPGFGDSIKLKLAKKAYPNVDKIVEDLDKDTLAYGGKVKVPGGNLKQLASDTVKAEGNTHEEGGIMATPDAEVEDQEIINEDKVLSNKIYMADGKSIAEHTEKYAKIKGKAEKNLNSNNFRKSNSAKRTSEFADIKMNELFNAQEEYKAANGISNNPKKYGWGDPLRPTGITEDDTTGMYPEEDHLGRYERIDNDVRRENAMENVNPDPEGFDPGNFLESVGGKGRYSYAPQYGVPNEEYYAGDNAPRNRSSYVAPPVAPEETPTFNRSRVNPSQIRELAGFAVPFIDNVINAKLIKQTPEIPKPTYRTAYSKTAMPMKTTFNIDQNLSDSSNAYRGVVKNIDENTSSSQVGRANKLQAYSTLLKNKGTLYNQKENIETQLKNAAAKNYQDVNNDNIANKQAIDNINKGLTDNFNYAKMQRADDILKRKSANAANISEDASQALRDSNSYALDRERMALDSARYTDAAGYERMIGTPVMDKMVRSEADYKRIEKQLEDAGQKAALAKFRSTYGSKKK